jgi:tetratricopeptide (TPR) repeat protein
VPGEAHKLVGMLSRCLLLSLLGLSACGGKPPIDAKPVAEEPVQGGIADGERELTLGNPGRAIKILEKIPPDDSARAYAEQLLGAAKTESDAIARSWIAEVDLLIATQQFNEAADRCHFLLAELPPGSDVRSDVEKREKEIQVGKADAQLLIEDTAAQARDYLLANDLEGALRTLRSARSLVWEVDRERALAWERIITAAGIRLDKDEGGRRAKAKRAAPPPPPKKKKPAAKGAPPEPEPPPDPAAAAAEPTAEQLHIGGLLRQSQGHRERKDWFRAIQTYQAVLKIARDNADALTGLKELESQRQALIKEYMDKAQDHFLRQNLAAAAPYYKRVLVLDPSNEAATEGLRMHENLERIRRESGSK